MPSCGGDEGRHRTRHAGERADDDAEASGDEGEPKPESEQDVRSRKALSFAKKRNSAQAYRDVVTRYPGTVGAEGAQMELVRLRADEAREAFGAGKLKEARALAEEAIRKGDPMIAEQARRLLQEIDHRDAVRASKAITELLAKESSLANCKQAIGIASETLGEQPSAFLLRDLRTATLQPLTDCVQGVIDAATDTGSYAVASELVHNPATKRALGNNAWHALDLSLGDKTVLAIGNVVEPSIKKGKWEDAFATIKKWQSAHAAQEDQIEVASQQARDAITKILLDRGPSVIGRPKADALLADIARALALFEGMNVAGELKTLQQRVATWVECERLKCKPVPKPKLVFNFGAAALVPPTSVQASPTETLPNATKFWVLAESKAHVLVAIEQPASVKSWEDRMAAAKGWIDASVIRLEDTSDWLPVGKALEQVRVWLPTGQENNNLYLLGIVESVSGTDVTVKKISDGQTVTVKRDVLRTGNLNTGLKVLAFCGDELRLTVARFEQLVPQTSGNIVAGVMCLNAEGKDDKRRLQVLGSVRAKPEWLPPRRP